MKVKVVPKMDNIYKYISSNQGKFISNLAEVVAIQSVSSWPHARPDVDKMIQWAANYLKKLHATNVTIHQNPLKEQTTPDGSKIPLPGVLTGQLGNDPKKKTVCLYGHLDVQPAKKTDGWNTEPFHLENVNDKLYGRGASDDKGPVLGWLHAIEAYQQTNTPIPVNIKFVFEGMEESGSVGLDEFLRSVKTTFLSDVDYVCISDSYWLGKQKPCIAYGLRGVCYFFMEVQCASQDLHSGVFGGSVNEAMGDLIYMMNELIDKDGKILVTGIQDNVEVVTDEERNMYQQIDFDPEDFRKDVGTAKLRHPGDKTGTLMARWRFPSLSLHGIEGAFSDPGEKTVIPQKVIGKFSVRIVPNQTPEGVEKIVIDYCNKVWKQRGSCNKFSARMSHGGRCWKSDPVHPHYLAGVNATKRVYGVQPDMIREGGSIPITLTFQEVTEKNVMLLPMGACDDGAHSQNEKIDVRNYIEGTKLMATYLEELSKIH